MTSFTPAPIPVHRIRRDLFWDKISPEPNSGCWLWTAAVDRRGYGVVAIKGGASWFAHRVAYAFVHGEPGGLFVCHRCDTPGCVNPDHLFLGTNTDNMRDCKRKGRTSSRFSGVTHCVNGHEFTSENTYHWVNKGRPARQCRTCNKASSVRFNERQRKARRERNGAL